MKVNENLLSKLTLGGNLHVIEWIRLKDVQKSLH